jgi:hypothetical protein
MEKELSRWLEHAYREGLKVRNDVIRRCYGVEPMVRGRAVKVGAIKRKLNKGGRV